MACVDMLTYALRYTETHERIFQCRHTFTPIHSHTLTTTPLPPLPTTGPSNGDIRLVGGTSTHRGRVQVFVSNQWQNLFTAPADWTTPVADLVCRQLGFQSGLRGFMTDYDSSVDVGLTPAYRIGNLNCPEAAVNLFGDCSFEDSRSNSNPAIVQCTTNGKSGSVSDV